MDIEKIKQEFGYDGKPLQWQQGFDSLLRHLKNLMKKQIENESVDAKGNCHIEWLFPEIYEEAKRTTLTIGLSHTRSADDIRIKYDGDRDGWVIEQASVFSWPADDLICDSDWKEVAFIQAWQREKEV